jgi:ferredoxin-NADP reductase
MLFSSSAPTPVLAFITTTHLALVVLRAHRGPAAGPFSFVTFVSVLFAGSPWLLTSPAGLAVGLVAQVGWFAACERLLPAPPVSQPKRVAAPRAAPPRLAGIAPVSRPPREFVQTPVLAVFDETPDIRTFRLARPEGFEFKAGQFLTVRLRADGKEHVRCYSLTSPPGAGGHLEITVKRLGLVSGTLHATVRPGSMLSVRAPAGAFVYPAAEDRPLALIAGGVGITPLMCMLRHAIDTDPTRPITLFYSVRTERDIAFRDEILLLNRRHAQFRACVAISEGPVAGDFVAGRINESLITTTMPDIAHANCLLCGPQPMLEAMTGLLTSIGVPRSQINFEVFQAAIAASAGRPQPAQETVATPAGAHEVRFERSGVTTTIDATTTLLEGAEASGASIPSLCRAGVCGTCRTRVVSGDVDCASQMLDEQDRRDGYVLACVSHAKGDCTVDA